MTAILPRRLAAEALGTLLLVGCVIGSGILADKLSSDDAVSLLGNTIATAGMLAVLILGLGPVSGAHFNPAVTLVMALRRELPPGDAIAYVLAQCAGAVLGAVLAHAMFGLPLLQESTHDRAGFATAMSDGVATFALVFTILAVRKSRPEAVAYAVALVITAGYWWTASTSFANPAVTLARSFTDTFAGIRPADAPAFVIAQIVGALTGLAAYAWLFAVREPRDR
ncbi:MAG: MIP/aquaporin family protein [Hyphomonadaceae bacterium]